MEEKKYSHIIVPRKRLTYSFLSLVLLLLCLTSCALFDRKQPFDYEVGEQLGFITTETCTFVMHRMASSRVHSLVFLMPHDIPKGFGGEGTISPCNQKDPEYIFSFNSDSLVDCSSWLKKKKTTSKAYLIKLPFPLRDVFASNDCAIITIRFTNVNYQDISLWHVYFPWWYLM